MKTHTLEKEKVSKVSVMIMLMIILMIFFAVSCGKKNSPESGDNKINTTTTTTTTTNTTGAVLSIETEGENNSLYIKNNKKFFNAAGLPKKEVRILSLDGGGIRGLYETFLLSYIELYTGYQTHELFDIVGGNSTGGYALLQMGVRDPSNPEKAFYPAMAMASGYYKYASMIFEKNDDLLAYGGIFEPKYTNKGKERYLMAAIGKDVKLKDTVSDFSVFSLDFATNKSVRLGTTSDYSQTSLLDAIIATTSAVTFFSGRKVTDDLGIEHTLGDGGIGLNNPALALALYAQEKYDQDAENRVLSVYSFGTGNKKVVPDDAMGIADVGNIIGMFIQTEQNICHDQMIDLTKMNSMGNIGRYARIQSDMDEISLNNTSIEYKDYLINTAINVTNKPEFIALLESLPRNKDKMMDNKQNIISYILKMLSTINYNGGNPNLLTLDAEYFASRLVEASDDYERKTLVDELRHLDTQFFSEAEKKAFLKENVLPAINALENDGIWFLDVTLSWFKYRSAKNFITNNYN